ncbi:MAG: hydroxyethylthiazole kinase [Synergistaceae bacterium]
MEKIYRNIEEIKEKKPLVHSITNYVTVNDCANILLACGASPIMADDEQEVEEITSICSSLSLNIGTLNSRTIKSMELAGKKANEISNPVIFDPVGVGASHFRTETAKKLINKIKMSVIRGNVSEIMTIAKGAGNTVGVDADDRDAVTENNLEMKIEIIKRLSEELDSIIAVTGAIDIVTDSKKTYIIRNGHPMMSQITGAGCMLTALIAAFCGADQNYLIEATVSAVVLMGLSGEKAYEKIKQENLGTASYRVALIDEISKITSKEMETGAKIEIR